MDAIATALVIIISLVGLDLAALRWGTDSRGWVRDGDQGWRIY